MLLLETFTGVTISKETREESALCQRCFTAVEKFDDLQKQSRDIQANMMR